MKKKALLSLVIVLALFIIVGCGNSETKEEKKEEKKVYDSKVVINNLEFKLDKDASFKSVKYKIVEDFKEAKFDHYVQYYYYQEDNTNLLFFRVFDYEKKTIEEAITDLGLDENIGLIDGKTDNIEYKFYEEPRNDGTIHFYFVKKDDNLYILNFISKYDIKDFEEKILNSISLIDGNNN